MSVKRLTRIALANLLTQSKKLDVPWLERIRHDLDLFDATLAIIIRTIANELSLSIRKTCFVLLFLAKLSHPTSAHTILLEDNFDAENDGKGESNYSELKNWRTTDGSIDLIGNGYYDLYPGNGLYLDLDGSTNDAADLISRRSFLLIPDRIYTLKFDLGGSQRGDQNDVRLFLGNAYDEIFTIKSEDRLKSFTKTFSVEKSTRTQILFSHSEGDNRGIILDNFHLSEDLPGDAKAFLRLSAEKELDLAHNVKDLKGTKEKIEYQKDNTDTILLFVEIGTWSVKYTKEISNKTGAEFLIEFQPHLAFPQELAQNQGYDHIMASAQILQDANVRVDRIKGESEQIVEIGSPSAIEWTYLVTPRESFDSHKIELDFYVWIERNKGGDKSIEYDNRVRDTLTISSIGTNWWNDVLVFMRNLMPVLGFMESLFAFIGFLAVVVFLWVRTGKGRPLRDRFLGVIERLARGSGGEN